MDTEADTITFVTFFVNSREYSINSESNIFAFIALKLLYHISLWDENILEKLKIYRNKHATNYEDIIKCIHKFVNTGANLDILHLNAALPPYSGVNNSFVSVLNGVSTDNVDSFIASIIEAFKNPTPAAESESSIDKTASAAKPSTTITLNKLTRIVTAAYNEANAKIISISSKLTKDEFVKLSITKQAKEITDLTNVTTLLTSFTTTISNAITSYKSENEDPILKSYSLAIEAITKAIDKVTAAASSPPSGAADAADAAAAVAVKTAIEAVKKTNYTRNKDYEQQLDAGVGKVESATDDNSLLIEHLENLLFLVISRLDPEYEHALKLVNAAITAADDATSKADEAAHDHDASVTHSATDAHAAVRAATIYNNFFKTIETLNKEYGDVDAACKKVKTSITFTGDTRIDFKDVITNLKDLKAALEALREQFDTQYKEEDSTTFSLFDGGGSKTKTKSKSSSSHKSKSKSKNKTKNKTKKNHSHSDKRKIPKIKMN
jgi:hypothetical protein